MAEAALRRRTGAALALQIGGAAGSVALLLITARYMPVAERGVVAVAVVLVMLSATVAGLGLPSALLFFTGRGFNANWLLKSGLMTSAVVIVPSCLIATWLFTVSLDEPSDRWRWFGTFLFSGWGLTLSNAMQWMQLGHGRIARVAVVRTGVASLVALLVFALAMRGYLSAEAVLLVWGCGWYASAALLVTGSRGGRALSRSDKGDAYRYALASFPGGMANYVTARIDTWLVALVLGVRAAALYSVAPGLSEIATYIPQALGTALMSAEARGETGAGTSRSIRTVLLVAIALAAVAMLAGPFSILLLLGERYQPAIASFELLTLAALALGFQRMYGSQLAGQGRPQAQSLAALISASVLILTSPALAWQFGIEGAAVACVISYGSALWYTLAYRKRMAGDVSSPGTCNLVKVPHS